MRFIILLVLGGIAAFLAWPFVVASQAFDERGVALTGRIFNKSEYVRTRYGTVEAVRDTTVEYPIPETGGVSYFKVYPTLERYDAWKPGEAVKLRYLREADVPDVPLAKVWRYIHLLPMIRLEDRTGTERTEATATPGSRILLQVCGGLAILLFLYLITNWKPFAWALGLGFLAGVAGLTIKDYPRAAPMPALNVRPGAARVKNVDRITTLFAGTRRRGMDAVQPIQVVSLEFVPEGRTEPVVALDLIDEGSAAGLQQKGMVAIQYESATPRTAWIVGATRTFPEKNLRGAILQCLAVLGVLAGLLLLTRWLGRGYDRLMTRGKA